MMLTLDVPAVVAEDESEKIRLEILESRIERGIVQGMRSLLEIATAIAEVHRKKLYQSEYSSFEEYCKERWDMGLSQAYQYLDVAAIAPHLQEHNLPLPTRESHYRALAPLKTEPEKLIATWQEVISETPLNKVKGSQIQRSVQNLKGGKRGESSGQRKDEKLPPQGTESDKSLPPASPMVDAHPTILFDAGESVLSYELVIPAGLYRKLKEYANSKGVSLQKALDDAVENLEGSIAVESEVVARNEELEAENEQMKKKVEQAESKAKGFQPRKMSLVELAKETAIAAIDATLPADALTQVLTHLGVAAVNLIPFDKLNDALVRGLSGLVQRPGRGGRAKGQGSSQKLALIEYCQQLNQQLAIGGV